MKRWLVITLVLALALASASLVRHGELHDLALFHHDTSPPPAPDHQPAPMVTALPPLPWQVIEPRQQGFRLELPGRPQNAQASAIDDHGHLEPVQMIESRPEEQIQYVLCWSDNPPVLRFSRTLPDTTLSNARDGMLTRTHTALDNEVRINIGGFPAREIAAHNAQGGVLNARLILVGNRLYTLMALFPSAGERREADVLRFFQSFQLTRTPGSAEIQGGN